MQVISALTQLISGKYMLFGVFLNKGRKPLVITQSGGQSLQIRPYRSRQLSQQTDASEKYIGVDSWGFA